MDVPKTLLQLFQTKGINPAEAIHAAQHAFLNRFSMAQDVKTECKAPEKEYKAAESKRKRPARYVFIVVCLWRNGPNTGRLIFYDAIGKGGGVAAKAFDNGQACLVYFAKEFHLSFHAVNELLHKACNVIEVCDCEKGCTQCEYYQGTI